MSYEIIQLKVEDHDNFIHIIVDKGSNHVALVDPAWDAEGILEVIEDEGLILSLILLTHSHHDHVNAVHDILKQHPDIDVFISELEQPHWQDCPKDAILLQDGDEILLGQTAIGVMLTPGHTIGSCCYHLSGDLITGDTLFVYGCGRADLDTSDVHKLYHSLQKIKRLPEQTNIWVGHDYGVEETTTLEAQFNGNPFLMIDNEKDFVKFRMQLNSELRSQPYAPVDTNTLKKWLTEH